ncbi:DUF5667 domain-containing protein [Chloroflexota bacterium]
MRKLVVAIFCILAITFCSGGTVYAQDEGLPDPGITPDSPFYFLDTLGKNIGLFFTFGSEAKVRKAIEYAEERLAEAQAMAKKGRAKEVQRVALDYDRFMAIVAEKAGEVTQPEISDNISERVALASSKHLTILDRVRDVVPEQAKEAVNRAREASLNGQKNALRALAKRKTERAMEINIANIEERLSRAAVKAADNITEEVEEALDETKELLELEEEISDIADIAEGLGKDITSIEQRIAKSVANRLEVLERVYEKVPEQAKPAIESAIANSVRKHERAIEALKKKSALGEITEEVPLSERIRERIKQRPELRISANNTAPEKVREEVKERAESGTSTRDSANSTAPEKVREEVKERAESGTSAESQVSENETGNRQEGQLSR